MLKAGITGGIGSGKSLVCQVFETLGIPVFYADAAARYIMENDDDLVRNIKDLFGPQVYVGHQLDRKQIAAAAFADASLLGKLNALVHPVARRYAANWAAAQSAPYIIKEAAIFFESGTYTDMDVMIGVSAPASLRLQRATARGHQSAAQVQSIMAQQMDEDEKMSRCDYIIANDATRAILPQVLRLHEVLLLRSRQ